MRVAVKAALHNTLLGGIRAHSGNEDEEWCKGRGLYGFWRERPAIAHAGVTGNPGVEPNPCWGRYLDRHALEGRDRLIFDRRSSPNPQLAANATGRFDCERAK